jgi:hypothetical protein
MDPTKKELYTAKRSSGINCSDPQIQETWNLVRDDNNVVAWMLLGYADPSTIQVISNGEGSIEECIGSLSDDAIYFGAFRAIVAGSVKFFSVS